MAFAVEAGWGSRLLSPPNPWVGAVVVAVDGRWFTGGTQRPGHRHAERVALDSAGAAAEGATLYTTLEPCTHTGRTGPCTDAIIAARVSRVVIGVLDPDPRVAGTGAERLRAAGIVVDVGVGAEPVEEQLRPYLVQRRTGRPWVVLKLAATLDGRTAAPDGSSQWITGPEARADAHQLRARSDAVLVGAATVRDDDPRLTVRGVAAPDGEPVREPLRVVLGSAPADAAIRPCLELGGDLVDVLDELGRREVVQLMVEGGSMVAGAFHQAGLVNEYVVYLAPAFMGGADGRPLFGGAGAASLADITRGRFVSFESFGADARLVMRPDPMPA